MGRKQSYFHRKNKKGNRYNYLFFLKRKKKKTYLEQKFLDYRTTLVLISEILIKTSKNYTDDEVALEEIKKVLCEVL